MSVICRTEFHGLKKNTKNVLFNDYYLISRANWRDIALNGRYNMNRVNKLIAIIPGEINKLVKNTYLKMQIPMLCRKIFINMADNRDFVYGFCDSPYNRFHEYCPEWYSYNEKKAIQMTTA